MSLGTQVSRDWEGKKKEQRMLRRKSDRFPSHLETEYSLADILKFTQERLSCLFLPLTQYSQYFLNLLIEAITPSKVSLSHTCPRTGMG